MRNFWENAVKASVLYLINQTLRGQPTRARLHKSRWWGGCLRSVWESLTPLLVKTIWIFQSTKTVAYYSTTTYRKSFRPDSKARKYTKLLCNRSWFGLRRLCVGNIQRWSQKLIFTTAKLRVRSSKVTSQNHVKTIEISHCKLQKDCALVQYMKTIWLIYQYPRFGRCGGGWW